jgi:hypothetical protein
LISASLPTTVAANSFKIAQRDSESSSEAALTTWQLPFFEKGVRPREQTL